MKKKYNRIFNFWHINQISKIRYNKTVVAILSLQIRYYRIVVVILSPNIRYYRIVVVILSPIIRYYRIVVVILSPNIRYYRIVVVPKASLWEKLNDFWCFSLVFGDCLAQTDFHHRCINIRLECCTCLLPGRGRHNTPR